MPVHHQILFVRESIQKQYKIWLSTKTCEMHYLVANGAFPITKRSVDHSCSLFPPINFFKKNYDIRLWNALSTIVIHVVTIFLRCYPNVLSTRHGPISRKPIFTLTFFLRYYPNILSNRHGTHEQPSYKDTLQIYQPALGGLISKCLPFFDYHPT